MANHRQRSGNSLFLILVVVVVATMLGFAILGGSQVPLATAKTSPEGPSTFSSQDDESETPTVTFRKLASVPTQSRDDLRYARLAVSFDQEAVMSRNFIVSKGEDVRGRIGAYLWRLDPEDPKRTKLPDSTTFGFVPDSTLAYQVNWGRGVQFWDTGTHERLGEPIQHELREDTTIGPAISPDGQLMVTRSRMEHLQFWNLSNREPITEELKQTGIVYSMRFSTDGRWFFGKTGRNLTVWRPESGEFIAGPFKHDIYSYVHSPSTNRLITFENSDEADDVWKCRMVIRAGMAFEEIDRIEVNGRTREAAWIDDHHILVVADYRDPDEARRRGYRMRLAFLVTLTEDEPDVRQVLREDWIRGSEIAPDRQHFIIRARDRTSCWKLGEEEPLWTKTGDPLVYFGDKDWVMILDEGTLIACSLTDGRELWRKNNVDYCRVTGSKIWIGNEDGMEIWQGEPQSDTQ